MAAIQNDRDVLLQAASVRVVPVTIQIDGVAGLGDALKRIEITPSAASFIGAAGTPTPTSITLTASLKNGLTGVVTWAVEAGSATLTPSGVTCSVLGSSVTGDSVAISASVIDNGKTYKTQIILPRHGALSTADKVSLVTQVTGQLAADNITGLGALALLNTVNLNTQTTGALNGATQVTNLGSLAYANAIAADQIGAGTLAAGVVYAGTINAEKINGGNFTGKTFTGGRFVGTSFATAESGARVEISNSTGDSPHTIIAKSADFSENTLIRAGLIFTTSTSNINYAADIRSSNYAAMGLKCHPNTPHMVLEPIPTKPSSMWPGGIAYSSLHGFIFCNGVNWYKPAGWTVV